jgi:hypothetical protein
VIIDHFLPSLLVYLCNCVRLHSVLITKMDFLMGAEDPAMRERLVTLKLQRDRIAKEIGELQNRMASLAPTITPEKVARVGGLLREKFYEILRSSGRRTPGC